ncbi:MAG: hypothetical protein JWO90_1646 [Solirubrobacterales bacterium]|nr:hypothetical protein [Solirubrobacterales bacterium]
MPAIHLPVLLRARPGEEPGVLAPGGLRHASSQPLEPDAADLSAARVCGTFQAHGSRVEAVLRGDVPGGPVRSGPRHPA